MSWIVLSEFQSRNTPYLWALQHFLKPDLWPTASSPSCRHESQTPQCKSTDLYGPNLQDHIDVNVLFLPSSALKPTPSLGCHRHNGTALTQQFLTSALSSSPPFLSGSLNLRSCCFSSCPKLLSMGQHYTAWRRPGLTMPSTPLL